MSADETYGRAGHVGRLNGEHRAGYRIYLVAKDTSRRLVGSEDCWIHTYSTPFYTFQKVTHSALRAITVVLFHHYRLRVIRSTSGVLEN